MGPIPNMSKTLKLIARITIVTRVGIIMISYGILHIISMII